jgi:hypothetical protein
MRPLESHEAVEERQLREFGIKINSIRGQSYAQGLEDGIKTTALIYPVNKNGKRKIIVINALGIAFVSLYGEIEKIKELNDKIYIYLLGEQRVSLAVDKKEEK